MSNEIIKQDQPIVNLASIFKKTLPYGKLLSDEAALSLAIFSKAHDLDPANGECYFMVKEKVDQQTGQRSIEEKGVVPGIKGFRKHANNSLRKADPQAFYHVQFDTVDHAAQKMQYPGDVVICVQATLTDSISKGRYIMDLMSMKHEGFTLDEIEKIIGTMPRWIGFGVVKAQEAKYIKVTPYQLACKRAEAAATKLRFDLGFGLSDDVELEMLEAGDVGTTTDPFYNPPAVKVTRPEKEILAELGYEPEEQNEPEPVTDGEFQLQSPTVEQATKATTSTDYFSFCYGELKYTSAEAKEVLAKYNGDFTQAMASLQPK